MTLRMPRLGRWSARVQIVDSDAFHDEFTEGKPCELGDDATTLAGHVHRARADSDVLMIAGGPDALDDVVSARSFDQATLKQIAADTLANGASLSQTSTPAVVGVRLDYTRVLDTMLGAVKALAGFTGADWRVLPDGSMWLGTDTYPTLLDFDATVLDADGASGTVLVAVDSLALRPGVTWRGYRVSDVEHSFSAAESLRTTVWIA